MPEPITIYEVRENYCFADDFDGTLTIESNSHRLFQTRASAQLCVQEKLNALLEARLNIAQRFPEAFNSTPEALAALAANKLHLDITKYSVQEVEATALLPVYFVREVIVSY